ncbi:unnamed protein product [Gadus morhua 'NCC']
MPCSLPTQRWGNISTLHSLQRSFRMPPPLAPLLQGMDYIKAHLEEETAHLSPANGSSESDEEDFFASFKKSAGQEVGRACASQAVEKPGDKEN